MTCNKNRAWTSSGEPTESPLTLGGVNFGSKAKIWVLSCLREKSVLKYNVLSYIHTHNYKRHLDRREEEPGSPVNLSCSALLKVCFTCLQESALAWTAGEWTPFSKVTLE